MKEGITDSSNAGAVGALATSGRSVPTDQRRNGNALMGYLRQAALRREQCDMAT
jgi:hypothetical protein